MDRCCPRPGGGHARAAQRRAHRPRAELAPRLAFAAGSPGEAGRVDEICPPRRVEAALATVRRPFAIEGAADRLVEHVHDGAHRWGGGPVWPWLADALGAELAR